MSRLQWSDKVRVEPSIESYLWAAYVRNGVLWAVFDIENTLERLSKSGRKELSDATIQYLLHLHQEYGLGICLATNSTSDFGYMLLQLYHAGIPASHLRFFQPRKASRWKRKWPVKRMDIYWRSVATICECQPWQMVMAGDKLLHDIKPALKAGFYAAIWVAPLGDDLTFEFVRRWYESLVRHWYSLPKPQLSP